MSTADPPPGNLPGNRNDTRPLYARVRELLIERIRSGAWRPGQLIPNEFEIAAQFGVSQGTARKAIDSLATDQLLLRRQGRGTFVVEHTPANVLFRFFSIYTDEGEQILPAGEDGKPQSGQADPEEARALGLGAGDPVIRIERVRRRDDTPFVVETTAS